MNRRQMFGALAAMVPVGVAATSVTSHPRKYGVLTVETYERHRKLTGESLIVRLDGEDVTRFCRLADDSDGVVEVIASDGDQVRRWRAKGGRYIGDWIMEVRGNVVISPGPKT